MRDLAPEVFRQRLVVEGMPREPIAAVQIVDYLAALANVLDMQALTTPIAHLSPKFGWAGWVHWETSGAHFYAWDRPKLFFSVDIYTCKAFDVDKAVDFTRVTFEAAAIEHHSF